MKHKHFLITVIFIVVFILSVRIVWGQIPQTISYQALLTDAQGKTVADGPYKITFGLYDAATDGTILWQEAYENIEVKNGIINVILGSVVPLDLPFEQEYWLGISLGNDPELAPRIELTASAYSLNARTVADGAITGAKIAPGQVVRSINAITDTVTLAAGDNVTITQMENTLKISATVTGAGDGHSLDAADGDPTDVVFVDNDGKVGIGTDKPEAALAIVDGVFGTDPLFKVSTDEATSMVITNTGNVGIGTTSPQGRLDVNGSIYQRGRQLHADYVFEPDFKLESIREHR